MPREFGYEWSGFTLQQKKSEGEAGLIFGMAILFVFLLLAAQYESWALPFAVLLCTPLVVLGKGGTRTFSLIRCRCEYRSGNVIPLFSLTSEMLEKREAGCFPHVPTPAEDAIDLLHRPLEIEMSTKVRY